MGKIFSIIAFLIATSLTQASIPENMPQSIYDQIIQQVIQDKGYLDMSTVQESIAQWQLQQPLPPTDGILVETGNCTTCSANTQGISAQFKKPRNVRVRAKKYTNGKYPSVLKVRWLKPKKLKSSLRSQYKVSHYLIYISKDGQSYEILKKKAKYFKSGKLKRIQRIKFKDRTTGSYAVQVQAVYKLKSATNKSGKKSINKTTSADSLSPWSPKNSFATESKYTTVGQYTGAIHSCLNNNGFTDATLLTAVDPSIDCTGYNLQNADIDLMANLTNIRSIIITDNPAVTDISILANLNYLEYLDLSNNLNIILPDFAKFEELITLKLANMGLTTVPALSTNDLLTTLDLNDNSITSGFDLLPSALNVLEVKGSGSSYCQINSIPAESIVVSADNLNLADCAAITGLKFIGVDGGAFPNTTQDISAFTGDIGTHKLCGLNITNTNLEQLDGMVPIEVDFHLSNNTNLNYVQPLFDANNNVIPMANFVSINSSNLYCGNRNKLAEYSGTTSPANSQTPINKSATVGSCGPIPALASYYQIPSQCVPDPSPLVSMDVYEDTNTQRRYITWTIDPNFDYALWGVTYFKIQGLSNVNGDVVYERNIALGTKSSLVQNSFEPNVYTIRACTPQQCGDAITTSAPFAQGLSRVTDLTINWLDLQGNSKDYKFSFNYPSNLPIGLSWESSVITHLEANSNSVAKISGSNTVKFGAVSTENLQGNGYVEFQNINLTNQSTVIGLTDCQQTTCAVNQNSAFIDYGIQMSGGNFRVYENNDPKMMDDGTYFAPYNSENDVFRVLVIDGVIKYLKNNEVIYTSQKSPGFPLVVGASLSKIGDSITNISLVSTVSNNTSNGGYTTYFEIHSDFTQTNGETLIETIPQSQGNQTTGWLSNTYNFSSVNQIGNSFTVSACNELLGCGVPTEIIIQNPVTSLDLSQPQGFTASSSGSSITLNWNVADNTDIDYFEVAEEQPYISAKTIYSGNIPSPSYQRLFYLEERDVTIGTNQYKIKLKRQSRGDYSFVLRSCHRDRVNGDVCSFYNSGTQVPRINNYKSRPENPVNFKWYVENSGKYGLVWDLDSLSIPVGFKPDYFYLTNTNYANDNTCQYEELTINYADKIKVGNKNTWTVSPDCSDVGSSSAWKILACYNGLGCSSTSSFPAPEIEVGNPNDQNTDIIFLSEIEQTYGSVVGGPGDLNPGMWWNKDLAGTGWHFYWASELRYDSTTNSKYGKTYDLIGYWFAYREVRGVWTPVWFEARMKQVIPDPLDPSAGFFQGDIFYHERSGETLDVGNIQINFGSDNQHAELIIDPDHPSIFAQNTSATDLGPYTVSSGKYHVQIQDFEIDNITVGSTVGPRFKEKNNADHYSGLWQYFDANNNAEVSVLTWIEYSSEVTTVATFDASGMPVWYQGQTCDNDFCNRSTGGYFTDYISQDPNRMFAVRKGFNPLANSPNDYVLSDNLEPIGNLGRCYSSSVSGDTHNRFKEGLFWLSINNNLTYPEADGGPFSRNIINNYGSQTNDCGTNTTMLPLVKKASLHDIRFFINGNDESVTTCDPNIDGECVIKFTWYTDDFFPSIEPYYKRGTGPYLPLSGLCGNTIPTDVFVVTDYQCTITIPGTYTFQLRKANYLSPFNKDVVIAESQDLEVIECNGDCTMPVTPILSVPGPIIDTGFYTISWSSSPNATGYVLEESIDAVNWTEVYVGNNLDVLIKGKVIDGATYYYRIKARNNAICSPYSPVSEVTVIFNCSNAPSVPDSGDFIQEMENSVASLNRTSFTNKSVIPELAEFKIPETYILGVPNEKINILNASVTYEYNDVVIPGSNGLDLIVKRELGTFEMVSKVQGFKVEYCSGAAINDRLSVFIEGKSLISVGFASNTDVPAGTLVAYREGYFLKCNANNFPEIITSDGKTYTFGKTLDNGATVPFSYFVTEVKDEFNNTITFNYGIDFPYYCTNFLNLESMSRNDGAQIDFEYELHNDLPFISKAKYGGREVNYNYEYISTASYRWKLTSVIDQENRATHYEYYLTRPLLKNVTLPTGLKVDYEYNRLIQVDGNFVFSDELTDRTISGPDIPTNTISYVYDEGDVNYTNLLITQRFNDYALIRRIEFRDSALINPVSNNELHSDYVMIGTIKSDTYFYDNDPIDVDNQLEVLYQETNLWSPYKFGGVGCPQINDAPVGGTNDYFRICARPLLLKKTFSYQVKDGATNSHDTYVNEYLNYDKYGYPNITKQSKVNSTTNNRYVRQFYNHDTNNWILGQPTITQVSSDNINWTETTKNSYWPATGSYKSKLKYQYQYGKLNKYYQQYNTTGDLQRVNTSGTGYYEAYSNYTRGIAQTYTIPKRYTTGTQSKYQTVNDFGEIVSETDYIGITTDYTYDKLGRIKLIDYNECDIPANCTYQNDIFTYSDSPNITTKTKGNYRETKTYDVLGRIKLESTKDITDSTTEVTKSYTYGINGTLDYQSLPINALNATGGNGIEYEYDYLNRKTKETIFDSTRVTIRDFEYLKNNKVRITDGNGYKTTVEYLSYGTSNYSNPVNISQQVTSTPATYVTTAINYNLFDNISTITQGGITETRIYDNYQQLCKVRRPDVGVTAYGYYSSGLLNWQAGGTTGDTNDCLGVTASDKITFTYNNQNELWTKSDANGTILTTTTLLTNNVGTETSLNTDTTHLTLNYNTRGQLVTKVMDVAPFNLGSPGSGVTSWTYDDMGYTSTMTYPESDSILTYTNNALGQVTSIAESAGGVNGFSISAISYHPSGGLLSYTLGNGVTHITTRTNSGLPASMTDSKGATTLFAHSYAYDNESNLSSLIDGVDSAYNLSAITYDGLNRLKTLTGNWGATNFNYDNLSNITQMMLGSQTLDYVYGATNNRLESTTGSALFAFEYDDAGNITNNGFRAFDYDKQNRLISSQDVSFIHDGEDLIHSKSVVGEPIKYSLYGANQNILYNFESNGDGTVYYYLNDNSIANVKITGTTRTLTYQHNDALGSLAVETDVSGTVTKRYHYEPYGFTLEAGQADSPGFTGQIYDDDLGLNYMKARYYDPMIGRFYSNDPIGFDLGNPMTFNRYAYANNNPYKYVDKTGENVVLWIGGVGAGVIDFFKGEGFNKDSNLTGALGDGYTNGNIGGALLEDVSELVPAAKTAKYAGKLAKYGGKVGKKVGKFFKKLFGKCCFVAGTQVLSKDGYKNIEEIKLGELLWAKNIETGESDWKPVSKIYVEHDRGIYHIRLKKSDGNIINIEATDDHPFYVVDHGWKTTVELQVKDKIETKEAGSVVVVSVEDEHREDVTYNFEIADFHTFYVTKDAVLVHNGKNCNNTGGGNKAPQKGKRAKQNDNATEQVDGIKKNQARQRKNGDNTSIQSTKKSEQREAHQFKNIDLKNLDRYDN